MFGNSQQKYAFILGHSPELSRAEIARALLFLAMDFREIFFNPPLFLIEVNGRLDLEAVQDRLGGTVKIAKIVEAASAGGLASAVEALLNKRIKELRLGRDRFQFGFSVYGYREDDKSRTPPLASGWVRDKELKRLGIGLKKALKERQINSRFVVSQDSSLSSVIVQKERLIEKGADIIIVKSRTILERDKSSEQYYLGYTVAVQKFAEYSQRDYGRPSRDVQSGMLPPKLAKIMLNLSGAKAMETILDPFCGSGTIIQEALLLGFKNIIGADILKSAVDFTQNNLKWLGRKYQLDLSGVEICQLDARALTSRIQPESLAAIISEPYLGPSRRIINVQKIILELSKLYLKSFAEFYIVLKKGGRAVIIFPIINQQRLDILNEIKQLGFSVERLGQEPRRSLIYQRPEQRVAREIFIFKKN